MIAKLSKVQWLTVEELAELWAPELERPKSIVIRELRLALYKHQISGMPLGGQTFAYEKFKYQLSECPEDHQLPPLSTKIDREFVKSFCDKETWFLPSFWFEKKTNQPSFPGRPSVMAEVIKEFRRRADSNLILESLSAESRELEQWARNNLPGVQTPTLKTIQNNIRSEYRAIKK